VGRYKGNTFLIPLPGIIGQDAEKIAQRIIKGIMNTNISLLDGTAINLDLNTGIVSSLRISVTMEIEMLIEKAGEAASRARQDGDNQTHTIFI
jgi:GGDEF domain-containing protein